MAMVSPSRLVLGPDAPDRRGREDAARTRCRAKQQVARHRRERPAQPFAGRGLEPVLRPREDVVGDPPLEELAEQVFGAARVQLQADRHGGGELDELVVEQWHARLERHGHAHLVDLRQNVVEQVRPHVNKERPVHRVRRRAVGVDLTEPGERIVIADGGPELRRVEPIAHPVLEETVDVLLGARLGGRQAEVAEGPRPLHGQREQAAHARRRFGASAPQPAARLALEAFDAVAGVAGPEFVAAVARECHRHLLPRDGRHVIGRHGGRVRERLVQVPGELRQEVHDVRRHGARVVRAPEMLRNARGEADLVEPLLTEPDRRRQHRGVGDLHHGRDHRARVDAARQERAERDVADQAHAHGFVQQLVEPRQVLALPHRVAIAGERQRPVAFDPHAAALDDHPVGRRQFLDVAEDGVRRRDVLQGKVGIERLGAPFPRDPGVLEDGLDLRAEHQATAAESGVIERLDAESVAREEHSLRPAVPHRKREHAAEALDDGLSPLLVAVDDDLGVRAGLEGVPGTLQLGANVLEVVDLPVEHHPDRSVFVRQRLVACLQVDDAETPVAEAQAAVHVKAVRVRPAMGQHVGHRAERPRVDASALIEQKGSCDSAHAMYTRLRGDRPPGVRGRVRPDVPICHLAQIEGFELVHHAVERVPRGDVGPGLAPEGAGERGSQQEVRHRARQIGGVARRHQDPVPAVFDQFGDPADRRRDDGQARGHRLDDRVGKRLRSRRQNEETMLAEHLGNVVAMARQPHARLQPESFHACRKLVAQRPVAYDRQGGCGERARHSGKRLDERVVTLLRPQPCHGDQAVQAGVPRGRMEGVEVDPIRDAGDATRAHTLGSEPCGRRRRIGHDAVGKGVGAALRGKLPSRLVRVELPAAAYPDRYAGAEGEWEREDIGVEVGCVQHGQAVRAAPGSKCRARAQHAPGLEAGNRELGDRVGELLHERSPGPLAMKAGDVHREQLSVEAAHEFERLPLSSPRPEAGQEDADGHAGRGGHG